MNHFAVQRALFASTSRGPIQGYQLIAKSEGIDRATSNDLCRWSPTRMASTDPRHWTLNHYHIGSHTHAVTRTVLGGPEYSGRGTAEVVTLILLLDADQLPGYGFNPIAVARTAMALGQLTLPTDMAAKRLSPAMMPHRPLTADPPDNDVASQPVNTTVDAIATSLESGDRVAVIGSKDPLALLKSVLTRLPVETRRQLSFTTGLPVSTHRPFQLHFLAAADPSLQRKLGSLRIRRIDVA